MEFSPASLSPSPSYYYILLLFFFFFSLSFFLSFHLVAVTVIVVLCRRQHLEKRRQSVMHERRVYNSNVCEYEAAREKIYKFKLNLHVSLCERQRFNVFWASGSHQKVERSEKSWKKPNCRWRSSTPALSEWVRRCRPVSVSAYPISSCAFIFRPKIAFHTRLNYFLSTSIFFSCFEAVRFTRRATLRCHLNC